MKNVFLIIFLLSFSYADEQIFDRTLDLELKTQISHLISDIPIDIGGGCSLDKATYMAQLIKNHQLKKTADLGVYRGRSFFPQALAHKLYTNGIVYGVDPYSNIEAKQNDHGEYQYILDIFSSYTDFERLFSDVLQFLQKHQLEQNSQLLRMRSDDASHYFIKNNISLDLVHIDGNHDAEIVLVDVALYLHLLRPGGFLVMDDISWETVKPALKLAKRYTKTLLTVQDFVANDYTILQKY